MGATAAYAPEAVGANDAFTDNLALVDGDLFVTEPVRDPLVMFVAMLTVKRALIPSQLTCELMYVGNAVKEEFHARRGTNRKES